jgi:hypothetical protein
VSFLPEQSLGFFAGRARCSKLEFRKHGGRHRMEKLTDESAVQLTVSVPRDESELIAAELRAEGADLLPVSSEGFDGASTVNLIVALTPPVAAILAGLYTKRLAANRYISLKYKGIEVKGVSEATLLKIVERSVAIKKGS